MALLSKSCIYGIRASIYLAIEFHTNEFHSMNKIGEELNLSPHFLTKIMQKLTDKGVCASYRGPNGGLKLKKKPEDVKLIEIVDAIDGKKLFEECALGLEGCGKFFPCPLHYSWTAQRSALYELFERENLKNLSDSVKTAGFRLRTMDLSTIQEMGTKKTPK